MANAPSKWRRNPANHRITLARYWRPIRAGPTIATNDYPVRNCYRDPQRRAKSCADAAGFSRNFAENRLQFRINTLYQLPPHKLPATSVSNRPRSYEPICSLISSRNHIKRQRVDDAFTLAAPNRSTSARRRSTCRARFPAPTPAGHQTHGPTHRPITVCTRPFIAGHHTRPRRLVVAPPRVQPPNHVLHSARDLSLMRNAQTGTHPLWRGN